MLSPSPRAKGRRAQGDLIGGAYFAALLLASKQTQNSLPGYGACFASTASHLLDPASVAAPSSRDCAELPVIKAPNGSSHDPSPPAGSARSRIRHSILGVARNSGST
jgi:hypothetical protein